MSAAPVASELGGCRFFAESGPSRGSCVSELMRGALPAQSECPHRSPSAAWACAAHRRHGLLGSGPRGRSDRCVLGCGSGFCDHGAPLGAGGLGGPLQRWHSGGTSQTPTTSRSFVCNGSADVPTGSRFLPHVKVKRQRRVRFRAGDLVHGHLFGGKFFSFTFLTVTSQLDFSFTPSSSWARVLGDLVCVATDLGRTGVG